MSTLLLACHGREVPAGDARVADGGGDGRSATNLRTLIFPQTVSRDLDVLVVVDNSGSMGEEQAKLVGSTSGFSRLLDALRSPAYGADGTGKPCHPGDRHGCKLPNLHIGVVSTDLGAGSYGLPSCERTGGDGGRLQNAPRIAGCQPPADGHIAYVDGKTNIAGAGADSVAAVHDAFACISYLGTDGCGFEQPLEAARRALSPATNPNFLRADAMLAIVIISDEDDCSAQDGALFDPAQQALSDPLGPLTSFRCFEFGMQCDVNDRAKIGPRFGCVPALDWLYNVQGYVQFFKGLKAPGRVVLAAVAGPTDRVEVRKDGQYPALAASCTSAAGVGVPAIRIKAVVDGMGADGLFSSICEADYSLAFASVGLRLFDKLNGGIEASQCLPFVVLGAGGGVACQQGDDFGAACGSSCLETANCTVRDVTNANTPQQRSAVVSRCPAALWYPKSWRRDRDCQAHAACPCWRIVDKNGPCTAKIDGSPYALDIVRDGAPSVPTVAEVRCSAAAEPWGSPALAALGQCR